MGLYAICFGQIQQMMVKMGLVHLLEEQVIVGEKILVKNFVTKII
jgi:hypothetical protein